VKDWMDRKMERSTNDDWTGRWAKLRADVKRNNELQIRYHILESCSSVWLHAIYY
jgi:hypothetical protein